MELLTIGKKNLFKNKITAILTVSLVAIVMCCLILLLAINGAGKREIVKCIKEGGNLNKVLLDLLVFTEKGFTKEGGGVKAILSPGDLQLIKKSCPQVKEISFYAEMDIDEIRIGDKKYTDIRGSFLSSKIYASIYGEGCFVPYIYGAPPECIKVLDVRLKEGRFINNIDMLYKRRVCVLGGEVAEVLSRAKIGKLVGKELRFF